MNFDWWHVIWIHCIHYWFRSPFTIGNEFRTTEWRKLKSDIELSLLLTRFEEKLKNIEDNLGDYNINYFRDRFKFCLKESHTHRKKKERYSKRRLFFSKDCFISTFICIKKQRLSLAIFQKIVHPSRSNRDSFASILHI